MSNQIDVIAGLGLDQRARKSRWPARLDLVQSASGLFLGLFMWGHMAFVSSILISKDAMWAVTKMFEGQFLFGKSYPGIVAAVVALVTVNVRAPRVARHAEVSGQLSAVPRIPRPSKNAAPRGYNALVGSGGDRLSRCSSWPPSICTKCSCILAISARMNQPIASGAGGGGRFIWCCCSLWSCTAALVFTGWRSSGDGSRATIPIGRGRCSNDSSGESRCSSWRWGC